MHFSCHETTLKKIFSREKLNLTWNKQTNFHKLGPLSWVFQTPLRGGGDGKFVLGKLFCWVVGMLQRVNMTTQTFFEAKSNILLH